MKAYGTKKSRSDLFVHFDKNIYTNRETVWFTAYVLAGPEDDIEQHRILAVSLIRDRDSTIVFEDKFPIVGGIGTGSILLPDSIQSGEYHIRCFTDRITDGMPIAQFEQHIEIKSLFLSAIHAEIKFLKSTAADQLQNVLITVLKNSKTILSKPAKITYRYGSLSGTSITNPLGELLLKLPRQNEGDSRLFVTVSAEKDTSYLSMEIPRTKEKAVLSFYPEGGRLVHQLPGRVGWEVKDQSGNPIAVMGFLYCDDQVIDMIQTSVAGLGSFILKPSYAGRYDVRLNHSALADTSYLLTPVDKQGIALKVDKGVTNDSVSLSLSSFGIRKAVLRIHNFNKSFLYLPIQFDSPNITLRLPLRNMPMGLATITITDSLDRPLAERMIFAHYHKGEKLNISSDQAIYQQRQKVSFSLGLNPNTQGALVSVACVEANRIAVKHSSDIESYFFVNKELSNLPLNFEGSSLDNEAYLEQILLVRGWTKYKWAELLATSIGKKAVVFDSLFVGLTISKASGKPLNKPVRFALIGNTEAQVINIEKVGTYRFEAAQLFAEPDKSIYLLGVNTPASSYQIKVNDQFNTMHRKLLLNELTKSTARYSRLSTTADENIFKGYKVNQLKEVKIVSKPEDKFRGAVRTNACGDYVCKYQVLNCPNHPYDGRPPVTGQQYVINGALGIYQGCNPAHIPDNFSKIPGIHFAKEFYIDQTIDSAEPIELSTLYWNPLLELSAEKKTSISFYTSDITGRFKLIIQGVTNNGLVHAEKVFEVQK